MSNHRAARLFVLFVVLAQFFSVAAPILAQGAATPTAGGNGEYRDPAGRFSVPVPPNWIIDEADGFLLLRAPDGEVSVAVVVVAADDADAGIISAWQTVDSAFDPIAIQPDRVEIPSDPGVDQTVVLTYDLGQMSGRVAQGLGQRIGGQVYVMIFRGALDAVVRRQSQINVIVTGFRILSSTQPDLSGRVPLPLSGDRLRTFEAFVAGTLTAFGVPGASVAVVHGGRIFYAQGFGVTEFGRNTPVTPDTLMMIGSITKSFTTMMMGTLVDDGSLAWDQPVVEILPTFAVADPAITPKITIRNLVCACTGVPRRDAEIFFNANDLTAEGVIASLAKFPLYTPIGEAFQYSNQMVAAGGYVAALADGGRFGDLYATYLAAMRQRVLGPIGMTRSTFDPAVVAGDPDHAIPHGATLDGAHQPMPLTSEVAWSGPLAPAGGLWSSGNELARYLITELELGIGPDGTRVISTQNLEETWKPQVSVSAETSYGLGWFTEEWKGLPVVRHGGNTRGFTSDVAFFPDADLGIVVLTNAQDVNAVAAGIRQRLLELLYDQPSEAESQIRTSLQEKRQQLAQAATQYGESSDPALARTLTGVYFNAVLGSISVTFAGGALIVDTDEFRSVLRPVRQSSSAGIAFVVAEPSFAGYPVRFDTTGSVPRLIAGPATEEYVFERQSGPATPVS